MAKVAFIGLGVLGYPMAGHLLENGGPWRAVSKRHAPKASARAEEKGGHELTVYNRNAAKAEPWGKE